MIIISDTSPVSNLLIIKRIYLLKEIFHTVIIPPYVFAELQQLKNFGISITELNNSSGIKVISPKNTIYTLQLQKVLDKGEAEAISLALELNADLLLIDEKLGRKIAREKGLKIIGIIGVLLKAKEMGLINSVKKEMDELKTKAGFWLTDELYYEILKKVNEN